MDQQESQITTARTARTSALEILGHLQQLSRDTAEGSLTRVLDAAAEIPIRCLGVDKSLVLRPSAADGSYVPITFRNLSQTLLDSLHSLSDDNTLDLVLISQAPKVVEEISSLSPAWARLCALEGAQSLAYVPAATSSGPSALLVYMRSTRTPFTVWEIETLNTIANHVAAALRLNQSGEERSSIEGDTSIQKFTEVVFSGADLQALLDQTLDGVLNILQADGGSIMLREEGVCRLAASRSLQASAVQAPQPAEDTGVSMRVIAGRKPLLLHGQVDEQHFPGAAPRPELVSAMSVPLKGKRRIIGLLNVNSTSPDRLFSDEELAHLSTLAPHIAMTIENAKLYEAARAQTRYLANLYKIARTITSTLQLDIVLEMIMERLRTLIASDVCGLLLYDTETRRIQLTSGHGIPGGSDQDYIDLVSPALKLASSSRRPVVIPNLGAHPAYAHSIPARRLGLSSAVVAPLTIKRKVVGFVAAYRRVPRGFPRWMVRLLLGLAELAAIAIENARLYERQSGIANITQRELTPQRFEPIPGFEIGCKYAPAHQVGGDYYDLIKLGKGKFGIVIADVAGKNVTAAMHIAMCKHALRALADHIGSPAELLQKMNRFIYDQTDPEAFVTMFYGVLDPKRRTLVYSSAGHEPGLLLRAETGCIEHITTPGILLGIVPDATFEEHKTSIQAGDVLLLYTDGLIGVLSGYEDALAALETTLRNDHLKPAQELADNIHRVAVTGHTDRSPDDIALVTLKRI